MFKNLIAWVQMAIAPTLLAYQQLSQYLWIHLTAFLPRFSGVIFSEYHNYAGASAIATYKKLIKINKGMVST